MSRFGIVAALFVWLAVCPTLPAAEVLARDELAAWQAAFSDWQPLLELSDWAPHQVNTVVGVKGSIDRDIFQETDDTPLSARMPTLWKKSSYERTASRTIVSRFSARTQTVTPPRPSDPKRAYFQASGQFASIRELPDHFVVKSPGRPVSRLVRECTITDLVLVTEYRWRETMTGGVSHKEMKAARARLADLLVPLAKEVFNDRWAGEYDGRRLFEAIEGKGKEHVFAMLDQLHREMSSSKRLDEKVTLVLSAWQAGLVRQGVKFSENSSDPAGDLMVQFEKTIRSLVRRKDGKIEPFPLESILTGETLAVLHKVVKRRHGSLSAFQKKVRPLLAGVVGPFIAEGRPTRLFRFELCLPGAVVESNAAPPEEIRGGMCCSPASRSRVAEFLAVESRMHWQFLGAETWPVGYTMSARSLLRHEELQKKLFGEERLNTPKKAQSYADLVSGREKLLGALKVCRKEGRLAPLLDYRKAVSKDLAEMERVEKVLRLLQTPAE